MRAVVSRHVVHFSTREELTLAIHSAFSDLPCIASAPRHIVQIKDEEWEGEFVDLREDQDVPDHSVLAVVDKAQQVCLFTHLQAT